jgi:Polyketide cyclase / dehydrase and lipid transport
MIEITESMSYGQPATAIFAVLTDFAAYPAWQEGVESARLTGGTLRVGARVRQTRKVMGWRGQVEVTVAEFVPLERLTLASDEGAMPGVHQSYQLASEGDGCRVSYQLTLAGVPKMFERLVRAQLHHQVPRTLRRLGETAALNPTGTSVPPG